MTDSPIRVVGSNGFQGTVLYPLPKSSDEIARVQADDGRVLEVPASRLIRISDGTYELTPVSSGVEREAVIPVLAEELEIAKRAVPTGGVRVHRRVLEHDELVEMPLLKEHVDVRRVVVDREVDGPLPTRKEGDTTIIPVVEEVLVVQKRFVLKEEIHVTRTVREELHREKVTVRRQEADIEQAGESSRPPVVERATPVVRTENPPRQPRRSILGE